ncbi:MAG TPA: hypothetical protein VGX16_07390 [Solirubrobacteraceae bacterium]|nr:hypothetical protein [Solirubrobacteraceae bacterium]
MTNRDVHRVGTLALSGAMALIGLGLLAQSIAAHASLLSGRLLLGVLFLAASVGRTWVELRRGRGGGA